MNKRNSTIAVVLSLLLTTAIAWYLVGQRDDGTVVTDIGGVALKLSSATTLPFDGKPLVLSGRDETAVMKFARNSVRDGMRDYAKMTPAEQKKHLDEKIDQQEELRKSGVLKLPSSTQPSTLPSATTIEQPPDGKKKSMFVRRTVDDKYMMENMDPELRAMLAKYAGDMKQRRAERGLPDAPDTVVITRETRAGEPK